MLNFMRTPRLGAALYAKLCTALKTARDWNASDAEVEALRKAIQNREGIDVLTFEERELVSRIVTSYVKRSRPASRRRSLRAQRPAPVEKDLDHLSFLVEREPGPPPSDPN
jgi:hypothetical protein